MSWEEFNLLDILRIVVDIALVWFVIYKLFSVIRGIESGAIITRDICHFGHLVIEFIFRTPNPCNG